MIDFHANILGTNLRSLERTAQGSLSGSAKAHALGKLRRLAVDASTLNRSGGDAAVLGDIVQRATALADRLEGKRPAAAPSPAAVVMSTAVVPSAGNPAAIVQAANATRSASPSPPPPQVDHAAAWRKAIADAGGRPVADAAPATSTAAAGWRKAIATAMGRNL